MSMQVILDSLFVRPGSAPIRGVGGGRGGEKREFGDWTMCLFDRLRRDLNRSEGDLLFKFHLVFRYVNITLRLRHEFYKAAGKMTFERRSYRGILVISN